MFGYPIIVKNKKIFSAPVMMIRSFDSNAVGGDSRNGIINYGELRGRITEEAFYLMTLQRGVKISSGKCVFTKYNILTLKNQCYCSKFLLV